jgi:queuine tRNA-ribosyltransferase
MFKVTATQGKARVGILETKSGKKVETPFFMPVATKAVGRFVSSDDYRLTGTKTIICNQFLLSVQPGLETFDTIGSVHKFMGYDGVIFTDCGGFQMLRDKLLASTTNNGIMFTLEGISPIFMRPEKSMDIGEKVGSDVIMALDCVLPYGRSKEEYSEALVKSHRWTSICKDLHKGNQLLFGITQGGTFDDLRVESAKFINSLNLDGNAIGGVALGENPEIMYRIIDTSIPHLSKDKPRYVMGVGEPVQIVESVARGVDIFDSIYPQKNGRNGTIFTFNGWIDLGNSKYKFDEKSLDPNCQCFTCTNFSRAYIRYLFKKKDPVGKRYLTIHNIYFMQQLMKQIRESISEGTFEKFRERFVSKYGKIE